MSKSNYTGNNTNVIIVCLIKTPLTKGKVEETVAVLLNLSQGLFVYLIAILKIRTVGLYRPTHLI